MGKRGEAREEKVKFFPEGKTASCTCNSGPLGGIVQQVYLKGSSFLLSRTPASTPPDLQASPVFPPQQHPSHLQMKGQQLDTGKQMGLLICMGLIWQPLAPQVQAQPEKQLRLGKGTDSQPAGSPAKQLDQKDPWERCP